MLLSWARELNSGPLFRAKPVLSGILNFAFIPALGVFFQITTLLRGTPDREYCGEIEDFGEGFTRFRNCDEESFVELSSDPSSALDERSIWQSRPLMGILPTLSWPIGRLFSLIFDLGGVEIPRYLFGHLGLNILILFASYLLGVSFIRRIGGKPLFIHRLAIVLLTALSPVTKAFFWTAHTQLFLVLIGPLVIWLLLWARNLKTSSLYLVSLCLGLALLAYPGIGVGVAAAVLSFLVARRLKEAFLCGLIASGPALLWQLLVRTLNDGVFYSHETVRYRQFVWIFDSFESGNFLDEFVDNAQIFAGLLGNSLDNLTWVPISIVIALLFERVSTGRSPLITLREAKVPEILCALALVGASLYATGFYAERLLEPIVMLLSLMGISVATVSVKYESRARARSILLLVTGALLTEKSFEWFSNPGPWV